MTTSFARRIAHGLTSLVAGLALLAGTATLGAAEAQAAPRVDCAKAKCIALTFDDGPVGNTSAVLDALDAAGVKATFFVIGQEACRRPDLIRRMVRSGMVIGNHTYSHPNMKNLSLASQQRQVAQASDCITKAGAPRPTLLRPPYGNYNASTLKLGYAVINWNVDSMDWSNKSVSASTALVMKQTRRGSIILMHDIMPSTAKAVPGIIRQLKAKGYTFVTVPELLGRPLPGRVYRGA